MRIPQAKIEGLVSTEPGTSVRELFLDAKKGELVATDGKALACVPVEVAKGDKSGLISADVLKEARRMTKYQNSPESVILNSEAKVANGATYPRSKLEKDATYPNYRSVLSNPKEDKFTHAVCLNAKLLLTLADALRDHEKVKRDGNPAEGIVLFFNFDSKRAFNGKTYLASDDAIPVRALHPERDGKREAEGAIMPIRFGNKIEESAQTTKEVQS